VKSYEWKTPFKEISAQDNLHHRQKEENCRISFAVRKNMFIFAMWFVETTHDAPLPIGSRLQPETVRKGVPQPYDKILILI